MSLVLKLKTAFVRWRHGRGFGIHSPFAFHFVTEVLRQPYGYYAYQRLRGDDDSRVIFRVALALRPAAVAFAGADRYRAAVAEAVPEARITAAADADLIIVDAAAKPGFDLTPHAGKHVIVLNYRKSATWPAYKAAMPAGMTFANATLAISTAHPHLPRQDFEVKF